MSLGIHIGIGGRPSGSGYYILLGGVYGGAFDETTGEIGVIGTATSNLTGTLTWSIVGGGDADISINSSTGAVSSARAIYSGDSAVFTVQVTNGTLTIGFPFTATGTVAAYSAEATALFARFTSDPGTTRKGHINTLIVALKTAGVWAKLDALYVLAAHDSQAACRNWIANSYNLTATNSPTFTTDRGYTGNGSNAYLDTSFTPSSAPSPKYVQNSATIAAWCLDNAASANGYVIGTIGAAVSQLNPRSSTGPGIRGNVNYSTGALPFSDHGSSNTLFTLTRTASNLTSAYGATAGRGTQVVASSGVPTSSMCLLMANTSYSSRQMAVALIGSGFTGTNVTDTYNALNTYLVAVGAV